MIKTRSLTLLAIVFSLLVALASEVAPEFRPTER